MATFSTNDGRNEILGGFDSIVGQASSDARRDQRIAGQSTISFNENLTPPAAPAETLQETFGYPPDNLLPETTRKIQDSMPVCHFIPGVPDFTRGLDLFKIKNAWTENSTGDPSYTELLESHGIKTPNSFSQGIKVAYLADAFPTDTFTNEYGENFLQGITDVASQKAAAISQIMGTKTASGAFRKLAGPIGGAAARGIESVAGETGTKALDFMKGMASTGLDMIKSGINSINLGSGVNLVDRLAAGARMDFPMIWKSSGFQPSYTMTVRLYNPNPRSVLDTKKYIVGPIVALMLLAVPITVDGSTYSWPFFHRVISPGIFDLNPGYIANITVIKGGDQQQISQQQRLGIVDVRIDVGSLFSSMVSGTNLMQQKTRPTVRKYMNSMLNPTPARHTIYDRAGILKKDEDVFLKSAVDRANRGNRTDAQLERARQPQTKEEPTEVVPDRVVLSDQIKGARLKLAACTTPDCAIEAQGELDDLLEQKLRRDEDEEE